MDKNIFVYMLIDPRTNEVKYVGATREGLERYKRHTRLYYLKKSTLKNNWIKSLISQNLMPKFEILEYSSLENLREIEEFYIRYFKYIGFNLLNHEMGGYGIKPKTVKSTEEKKRQASISQTIYPIVNLETKEVFICMYDVLKKYKDIKYNALRSALSKDRIMTCRGRFFCYLTDDLDIDKELQKRKDRLKTAFGKHCKKQILEITTNQIFNSIKEAAEVLKIPSSNISHRLAGKNKSTRQYRFKYV